MKTKVILLTSALAIAAIGAAAFITQPRCTTESSSAEMNRITCGSEVIYQLKPAEER